MGTPDCTTPAIHGQTAIMQQTPPHFPAPAMSSSAAVLGNIAVIGLLVAGMLVHAYNTDLLLQVLQEDQAAEWITAWAFLLTGVLYLMMAVRKPGGLRWRWYPVGLAVFCILVALEEISWGQRLLGYRPPEYFLAENFQQEFNIHNILASQLRILGLKGVILGYGVALPVLAMIPAIRKGFERLGIFTSPVTLIPAFLATYTLYEWYPWELSGELTELMLSLGMLAAAHASFTASPQKPSSSAGLALWFAIASILGIGTAWLTAQINTDDGVREQMARLELQALRNDLIDAAQAGQLMTNCRLHTRLYRYQGIFDLPQLDDGRFNEFTRRGMPEERAEYFLDPWNSPYWIVTHCRQDIDRRRIQIYSFGADRRRNSDWDIQGDDLGELIVEMPGSSG